MKLLNSIILFIGLGFTFYLMSCGDDTVVTIDVDKIRADSLEQSIEENLLIDDYLDMFDLHPDSIRIDSTTGVRYAILSAGNGTVPNLNDIISMNYTGRFLSDTIFDTTIKSVALYNDSLTYATTYASNDSTFEDILIISDTLNRLSYEQAIDSLNRFKIDIDYKLYFEARNYRPITFNHTADGAGITNFIPGFTIGLNKLMNLKSEQGTSLFEVGGKGIIFIPSAVAYATIGQGSILPNTVLIFEFGFVNIKN